MVRVVSCHHFVSQDVFLSGNDPVAFCSAQNKLLISTAPHVVNVHDLDARGTVLHSFPSVDGVKQIIYCESGNYIATIESKTIWNQSSSSYVRVYFNWWVATSNQSLRVRLAGCAPTYDETNQWSKFQMVELPIENNADYITCCHKTSSLAVCIGNTISLFCYGRKMHPTSKYTYQDFEHFLDVTIPIMLKELRICENVFACRSDRAIHIFRVMFEAEDEGKVNENSGNLTFDSCDSDIYDDNFVEWRFESCTVSGARNRKWENHIQSRLDPKSFPIDIHLHEIDKENEKFSADAECGYYGPLLTVRGCVVDVRLDSKIFELFPMIPSNVYAVTSLFKQIDVKVPESSLSALQLLPYYEPDAQPENFTDPLNAVAQDAEKCLFSLPFPNVIGKSEMKAVGCFFSSVCKGFLYDITNETKLVETYVYTSSMKSVVMKNSLLHALTETGLETYTVHLCNSVLQSIEIINNVQNIVPSYDDAVCLLGLRPFLGVDHLLSSDNHIILVSSVEDSVSNTEPDGCNRCTLYSLKEPECIQMYNDLIEAAESQKLSSPNAYYHLLSEAYMILRTEMKFGKTLNPVISTLYKKSCLLLADYFLCLDPSNNMNCIPYYHLSQLPPETVIKRILELRHLAKYGQVLKPLVHYLNSIILDSSQTLDVSKGIGDTVLAAYSDEAPEMLWKLILCSNFSGYKVDKTILIFKHRLTNKRHPLSPISNAADTTALVYLLFQKGSIDIAQNMIISLIKSDLLTILESVHSKLWEEKSLTEFGKFIKKYRPDVFVELIVRYIEVERFTFGDALQILQLDMPDADIHKVPLLKEFLESFFSENTSTDSSHSSASILLIKVYFKKLLEPRDTHVPTNLNPFSGTVSSFANLFNSRPSWLNELPPFYGKGVARNCLYSLNENAQAVDKSLAKSNMCACWTCNEDFLKLQSLLSYLGPTEDIKNLVQDILFSTDNHLSYWLSLEVICSNEAQAAKRLLSHAPKAVLPYAKETFKDDKEKWSALFNVMFDYMKIVPDEHPDLETYSQTFNAILSHLAETLKPTDLLNLLPKEDNMNFLPHVKRCVEKHQADQLRNKIMSLGQEIKSMMLN